MGLVGFAGWLANQVFDVVGSVAGTGTDGGEPPEFAAERDGGDLQAVVDLQVGKTVFHDVPVKVCAGGGEARGRPGARRRCSTVQCVVPLRRSSRHMPPPERAAVLHLSYCPHFHAQHCCTCPCPAHTAVRSQMRTELWLSQLHQLGAKGGAPPVGEYYDLLFEVGVFASSMLGFHGLAPHSREVACRGSCRRRVEQAQGVCVLAALHMPTTSVLPPLPAPALRSRRCRPTCWRRSQRTRTAPSPGTSGEHRCHCVQQSGAVVSWFQCIGCNRPLPLLPALARCCRLATPAGQQAMLNVLRAYAAADPEIGYTQVGQKGPEGTLLDAPC